MFWLRARWRIENMFKYASEHNGIDAIACYRVDLDTDTRKVTNPARVAAHKRVKAAEADLAAVERALTQLLGRPDTSLKQKNAALPGVHARSAPRRPSSSRPRPRSNRSPPRSPRPTWTRTRTAPDRTWPAAALDRTATPFI